MTDRDLETERTSEPQTEIGPGTMVGEYRVLRLLGQGGMGEVFLCRDVRLGRKVALKVVRQDLIGDQQRQERFGHEARVTARFNHPHIVTVYGVGEHEGNLYVALEYLEGQNLAERLAEGRLGQREALRIGLAIAEALAEAHRHGVLHRDLKPQNVQIPRDGRLRVLDFGLARLVSGTDSRGLDAEQVRSSAVSVEIEALTETMEQGYQTEGKGLRGTPRYMAPEQWHEEPGTPATDVWALGMILYELLAGRHPFQAGNLYRILMQATEPEPVTPIAELAPDLPDSLVALVDRCVEKTAARRPTADAVVSALQDQLDGATRRRSERQSPYRGLLPFSERHADVFFGRDAEVAVAMERLRDEPVLPILGPSGAGKSSFVQAGLIPRLREQGRWIVLQLRPGSTPLQTLAARLLSGETLHSSTPGSRITQTETVADPVEFDTPTEAGPGQEKDSSHPSLSAISSEPTAAAADQLAETLLESPARLALELIRRAEKERARILLFVDQLEELYTLVRGPDAQAVRQAFVTALCRAADDPAGPVRVVFTLRDDFLWRLAEGNAAREVLGRVLVLRPPGPEDLVEILERPAARAGYRFEDDELPTRMVAEVQGEAAALPLLQFTAQMLWERRDRKRKLLTRSAYESIGGVTGALAHHADGTLATLTAQQERSARAIFLRLVTPESTRRVISRGELLEGLGTQAVQVLERFTQARAILQRKGRSSTHTAGRDAELELVHESLIRNWDRLATWLDESREERVFLAEIGQAAALWERRGCPESEVWTGIALADARRRAARCETLPEQVARFLTAAKQRARRQIRRRRLTLTTTFAVLVLVALGALAIAGVMRRQEREAQRQKREAQRQRKVAQKERLTALRKRAEAQREGARAAFARGALLETRAKLRSALEIEDAALVRVLWWRLGRNPLQWKHSFGTWLTRAAISPDGKIVATGGADGVVHLFEVSTGHRRVLRGHRDQVHAVAFDPTGNRLASGSWIGKIRIWDTKTGKTLRHWQAHEGGVDRLAFDPKGKTLASASKDHRVRLWNPATGEVIQTLTGHRQVVRDVQFSPDGRFLVSASDDRTAILWEAGTGRRIRSLKHETPVYTAAFSPDGRTIATAGLDGVIRLHEAATGRVGSVLRGHRKRIRIVRYQPSGRYLASSGLDGDIRLWSLAAKRSHAKLPGHPGGVYSLGFDASGEHLVSAGANRAIALWSVRTAGIADTARGHRNAVNGIAFSPDGRTLASAGIDHDILLWDVAKGQPRAALRGHEERVYWVAFHPDGRTLASVSADRTIRLWDTTTGVSQSTLRGHESRVYTVSFSPDGKHLATAGSDRTILVWKPPGRTPIARLTGHRASIMGLRYGPRGRQLASASADRTVKLWDPRTARLRATLSGHQSRVRGLAFSPDGRRLLTGSDDRFLRWWSLAAPRKPQRTFGPLAARSYWMDLGPRGKRIAAPSSDGVVRLLDATDGKVLHRLRGHRDEVNVARFGPGGRLLATSSDDGTVRLWDAHQGHPIWRAPLLRSSTRELFTHAGWQRLDQPTRASYRPPSGAWRRAVATRARFAAESVDGRWLCISTFSGALEIWDPARDRVVFRAQVGQAALPIPLRGGRCLILSGGHADVFAAPPGAASGHHRLRSKVTAAAYTGSEILLAVEGKVHRYDPRGNHLGSWRGGTMVTALHRVGDWLVLGFKDGGLELVPLAGQRQPKFTFEDTPASPVTRIVVGPKQSLMLGFANGVFGIWSLKNGSLLFRKQLHGPVLHLLVHGRALYVATELGQWLRLDLGPFHVPYCELLRQIWRKVPISWEQGIPVLRPPPTDHRCRSR